MTNVMVSKIQHYVIKVYYTSTRKTAEDRPCHCPNLLIQPTAKEKECFHQKRHAYSINFISSFSNLCFNWASKKCSPDYKWEIIMYLYKDPVYLFTNNTEKTFYWVRKLPNKNKYKKEGSVKLTKSPRCPNPCNGILSRTTEFPGL